MSAPIATLGYQQAAFFEFCLALQAFNAVAVLLKNIAGHVKLSRDKKHPRGEKKPPPKKRPTKTEATSRPTSCCNSAKDHVGRAGASGLYSRPLSTTGPRPYNL